MLRIAKKNEKVSVSTTVDGEHTGARAARVVSFDGDGKTQGTYTVRVQDGSTITVPAFKVNPWPASQPFPRFRKAAVAPQGGTWTYTVLAKGHGPKDPILKFTGTVSAKTRLAANRAAVKEAFGGRRDLCLFDVESAPAN